MEKDEERYEVLRERWRKKKLGEEKKKASRAALEKLGKMDEEDLEDNDPKRIPTYEIQRRGLSYEVHQGREDCLGKGMAVARECGSARILQREKKRLC